MRRLYALLPLLLLSSITVTAQEFDTVRVCTYNVLNFGGGSNDRLDELRMILNEIRPRVLLIQEIESEVAFNLFRDSVAALLDIPLRSIPFEAWWIESQDSYAVVFFDQATFRLSRSVVIADTPRDLVSMRLHYGMVGVGDSIELATAHWKAGDLGSDATARFNNSRIVRYLLEQELPSTADCDNVLFSGDLNVYRSSEPGYGNLVGGFHARKFRDPLGLPGDWHDNPDFAGIHSQSTRNRQFGGGVTGGMDDRFDFILLTDSALAMYVPGSYTTFGNDGQHFNDSINALPNLAVGPVMAQALHDASDHLPVYLDLVFPRPTTDVPEGSRSAERLDLVDGGD